MLLVLIYMPFMSKRYLDITHFLMEVSVWFEVKAHCRYNVVICLNKVKTHRNIRTYFKVLAFEMKYAWFYCI